MSNGCMTYSGGTSLGVANGRRIMRPVKPCQPDRSEASSLRIKSSKSFPCATSISFVTRVAKSPYRNFNELPPFITQSDISWATIVFARALRTLCASPNLSAIFSMAISRSLLERGIFLSFTIQFLYKTVGLSEF